MRAEKEEERQRPVLQPKRRVCRRQVGFEHEGRGSSGEGLVREVLDGYEGGGHEKRVKYSGHHPKRLVSLLGGVAQILINPRPSPRLADVGLFVRPKS